LSARRPTLAFFKLVLRLIGSNRRRWVYQRLIAAFMFLYDKMIIKVSRQCGKTYLASVLVAVYVLCGLTVVIAFPTLKQGKRLLLGESHKRIKQLQRYFPHLLRMKVDNTEEILCANGGRVIVLTTQKDAKSREGYSASLIIIDEAHRAHKDVFDELFPITFAQEQDVKVMLLGIGGYRNSLIHAMKKRGFNVLKLDGETIAHVYPPYERAVKEAKESLSEDGYLAQIMCEDILSGEKYIFEQIPALLDIEKIRPARYAGIDVGWSGDETVVTIMHAYPKGCEIVAYMKCKGSFKSQAAKIVEFLRAHNVPEPWTMIEQNGIGIGLIERMQDYSQNYNFYSLTKISKRYLVDEARRMVRAGELAILPEAYREEIEGLVMETKDDGTIEYEHSDCLSSLLMVIANLLYG
jgi:hypothetical protein